MIGFILGTSEGKKILSLVNEYTDEIAVSTATNYGGQLLKKFRVKDLNTKPLDKEHMLKWMEFNKIEVLVDASHPYAKEVTQNAINCCEETGIEYIRYERLGALEDIKSHNIIRVSNYEEAINEIKKINGNILNTTGGNNVQKFIDIDFNHRIIHRILPSTKVLDKIINYGVKIKDIIALQGPISYELEKAFIHQYEAYAILTKDSGIEGGVLEKFKAVTDCNIKLIVIEKPKFNYKIQFNHEAELVEFLVKNYNVDY